MNSEEIKEIGQLFLNISNQNHKMNLGLSDDDAIKVVTLQIDQLKVNMKALTNNPNQVDHLRNRLEIAIEASSKWKEELQSRFQKLEKKSNGETNDDNWLRDRVRELLAKVGKFGNQMGGYGGMISTLQKQNGERIEELKKMRKDYRELQAEMWDRFKLTEAWIETKDSAEKERIRLDILENGHTDNAAQKIKLSSSLDTVRNTPDATCVKPKQYSDKAIGQEIKERLSGKPKKDWLNWKTPASLAWSKTPISRLNNISVRSHNALIEGGYHYIGNLLTESPYDLMRVKNFGRKCLREIIIALEEKSLVLNMQKFEDQKKKR